VTVIEIFEAQWENAGISIPYVESVNKVVRTDDLPDQWASAMDQPDQRADVTFGSNPWVDTTGTILIGLFTRSGEGQADLDRAIREVRNAFHGYAKDGLSISEVDGPHDIDPQADGEWWRLALTAQYTYYERRDATGPGFGDWEGFPGTP
jgi:hypothetical protein